MYSIAEPWSNNKPEDYDLRRDEVKDTNMGVTCYLVIHPRGMLIYDTGLNDRLVGRPLYENALDGYAQIKFNTLSGQLADIGVRPANIDYLVLSHYHWDHIGNAGDFAASTWLVYKGDRDQMFSSAGRTAAWFSQYAALENSKTKLLSGDQDVFGDGTVVVLATTRDIPRGTARCSLRLKNTGPVVLSGDLYHYAEEARSEAHACRGKDHRNGRVTPQSRGVVAADGSAAVDRPQHGILSHGA